MKTRTRIKTPPYGRSHARGGPLFCARQALVAALLGAAAMAPACSCDDAPRPDDVPVVGRISAVPVEGGFEIVLEALEGPARSLQVDVKLDGALALAARAAEPSDVIAAGLVAPRDDFTVVVSDTRRIALAPGTVVRVDTDRPPGAITLSRARLTDGQGNLGSLDVVTP